MGILLFLPSFIVAIFLAFYIPGRAILGKQEKLSRLGIFTSSIILGIVLWGWQGYIFGFLHLRNLSYVYLLIFLGFFIYKRYYSFRIPKVNFRKFDWIAIVIAAVGVFGQIIPYAKNGLMTQMGLFISNYNNVDQVWHATLIEELVRRFPPNEPGLYGISLINYHFWFHLVTAELIRVFHLPLFQTQFIGMYALGPVLLALIAYPLATVIYNSKLFIRLVLFFLFFSGDAAGWVMLLLHHNFAFRLEGVFENATTFMDAPGRGFAVIIALTGLYLLFKHKDKLSWKLIAITGLLFGSLAMFKIYISIPFMLGLFFLSLINGLKRNFSALWSFIIASIFSLVQFLPFNASSGGLFFLPVDIPRNFITQKGLELSFINQRWTIYLQHQSYIRLTEYGIFMIAVYLFMQFGVKLIGLLPLKKVTKAIGSEYFMFLYSILLSSLVLGLFFYQRVGGANIWEFFMTSSLILSILVSLNLSVLLAKFNKVVAILVVFIVIAFTIPRWIYSVNYYLQADYFSAFHGVSNSELRAYDFLKNNTPKNSELLLVDQPAYTSYSSLASVLTERNLFFSGTGVSQVVTPEYLRREEDVALIKTSKDYKKVEQVLAKDQINYVMLYNNTLAGTTSALLNDKFLKEVFSNSVAKIFKVN